MIRKPLGVVFSGCEVMVRQSEVGLAELNFQTSVRVVLRYRNGLSISECRSVGDGAIASVALVDCSILSGGQLAPGCLDRDVMLLHYLKIIGKR